MTPEQNHAVREAMGKMRHFENVLNNALRHGQDERVRAVAGYLRELADTLDATVGPERAVLGDYVETLAYRYKGRVYRIHESCPEEAAWLAGQSDPRMREHADGPWVSILNNGGGACVMPVALVRTVEPFEFEHRDAALYFGVGA